ncbi:MAG: hypothetical protein JW798_03520 [Prolixibacteraceae bacterium]|nr:hypothetical protein [Prolixibacteraceae bacterium]
MVRYLAEIKPQCLAISATMTFHISTVEEMIKKIKAAPGVPDTMKILVGGYPFKIADGLWKTIGADGFANSATGAVEIADQLIAA